MKTSTRKSRAKTKTGRKRAKLKDTAVVEGFYEPVVVASMLTGLLLNATEDGQGFTDFRAQLTSAIDMARASEAQGADDYRRRVETLLGFYDATPRNKALFLAAHTAVANLLNALIETGMWSPCYHVNHATIKGIFSLPQ